MINISLKFLLNMGYDFVNFECIFENGNFSLILSSTKVSLFKCLISCYELIVICKDAFLLLFLMIIAVCSSFGDILERVTVLEP